METLQTKTAPCPSCGVEVTRPKVMFLEMEICAKLPCLCGACDAAAKGDAEKLPDPFLKSWHRLIPPDYHEADPARVKIPAVLAWQPMGRKGVGIYGRSDAGKTNAMALLVKKLRIPFRWTTGAALRQLAIDSRTADGADRDDARKHLAAFRECPLLVIDDLAEVKFTEAYAEKLFEIMEHRNGQRRLTCWTAQHGPGQLAGKIGKGTDEQTAAAIERRLCQHHDLFQF